MHYLITDENMQICDGRQLETNKWYETRNKFQVFAYPNCLFANLLNPVYSNFLHPRLFKIATPAAQKVNVFQCAIDQFKIVEELPVPEILTIQKIKFAILCVKQICKDKDWNFWADDWLKNKDRNGISAVKACKVVWDHHQEKAEHRRQMNRRLPSTTVPRTASEITKVAEQFMYDCANNFDYSIANVIAQVGFTINADKIDFDDLIKKVMGGCKPFKKCLKS